LPKHQTLSTFTFTFTMAHIITQTRQPQV